MEQFAKTRLKYDVLTTSYKKGLTITTTDWEKWIFQEKCCRISDTASPSFQKGYLDNRNSKSSKIRTYRNQTSRYVQEYQIQRNQRLERPPNSSTKIEPEPRKRWNRTTWRESMRHYVGSCATHPHIAAWWHVAMWGCCNKHLPLGPSITIYIPPFFWKRQKKNNNNNKKKIN